MSLLPFNAAAVDGGRFVIQLYREEITKAALQALRGEFVVELESSQNSPLEYPLVSIGTLERVAVRELGENGHSVGHVVKGNDYDCTSLMGPLLDWRQKYSSGVRRTCPNKTQYFPFCFSLN